jgi:hypothetical protein
MWRVTMFPTQTSSQCKVKNRERIFAMASSTSASAQHLWSKHRINCSSAPQQSWLCSTAHVSDDAIFVQSEQALEKQARQELFSLAIVDVLCDKNITFHAFDSHCVRKLRQWIPSFEPLCSRTRARSILGVQPTRPAIGWLLVAYLVGIMLMQYSRSAADSQGHPTSVKSHLLSQ